MNPFITLSVAVLSGGVSAASLLGPFTAALVVVGVFYFLSMCQRSRTMADVYRVPMIMKKQGSKFVLDSEADRLSGERAERVAAGLPVTPRGTPRSETKGSAK